MRCRKNHILCMATIANTANNSPAQGASSSKDGTNVAEERIIRKEYMCPIEYGNFLRRSGHPVIGHKYCKFGANCYNAHSFDEMVLKEHIEKFQDKRDFSDIDIGKMRDNVIEVLEKAKDTINNIKYRSKISKIHELKIDELMAFWFDITCYHRRIAKELPTHKSWQDTKSKPQPKEGFHFKSDVPTFALDDEDNAWSIERLLHMCPKHLALLKAKETNTPIHIDDLCGGHINCKLGVHIEKDMICVDDLTNGMCSCVSPYDEDKLEELDEEITTTMEKSEVTKQTLEAEINLLHMKMNQPIDEDGFTRKLTKQEKEEIKKMIQEKEAHLNSITKPIEDLAKEKERIIYGLANRKLHLTDLGLVPLCEHLEKKAQEKEIKAKEDEIIVEETEKVEMIDFD